MKKSVKFISTVMAGLMLMSAMPAVSASAATAPSVTVENVNKGVKVSWTKAGNAGKYVVKRKLSTAKKYTTVKTVTGAKAGSFVDKKAKAGKTYNYKVEAVSGKTTTSSGAKNIVRLTTPTIWADAYSGYLSVWINKQSKGAKTYEVYRAKVNNGKTGSYKKVATLDATDEWDMYEETVQGAVNYKFKVRAVNGKSKSAFSKVKTVDYAQAPTVMPSISLNYDSINVMWASTGADGYRIYRAVEDGKEELIADLTAKECEDYALISVPETIGTMMGYSELPTMAVYSYKDTDVTDGTEYHYTMEAYYGDKVSEKDYPMSVTFHDYAYAVKVGETNNDMSKYVPMLNIMVDQMIGDQIKYEMTFTSEDESIATVDANGKITGVAEGRTNIVVTVTINYEAISTTATETMPIKVISE